MRVKALEANHKGGSEDVEVVVHFAAPLSDMSWDAMQRLGDVIEAHLTRREQSRWRRLIEALR